MESTKQRLSGIFALPNEIFLNIFYLFPTKTLLDLSLTCNQFHSLAVRVVQQRLQIAAGLDGHTLYLECCAPAAKGTTSQVFCIPLGTSGMPELLSEIQNTGGRIGHVRRMGELYSHFRPVNQEPNFRSVPRPHPAGDIPGSNTYMSAEDAAAAWKRQTEEAVTRSIHFDASCLFSQLETVAYLGRRESTRGLLFSIQEVGEGTIRVKRHSLTKQCQAKPFSDGELVAIQHDDVSSLEQQNQAPSDDISSPKSVKQDPKIFWLTTTREEIGIKFQVREQLWLPDQPVLFVDESEAPVSYKVELEEVLVRTTTLLLKLEESGSQILNPSGKAMVFRSYME